jgi:hypothetical protein
VIAVLVALAFGGGFALSDWRTASRMERLNSSNAMLSVANDKCATDIQAVRTAMEALTAAAATREKDAVKAMRASAPAAAKHTENAKKIRALPPPVAAGKQCEAISAEQIRFVESRHRND